MTLVDLPPLAAPDRTQVEDALHAACARIAPLWPLERFVAVNPYLGLTDLGFADAAERLAATAGARTTLPVAWYLDAIAGGRITHHDVAVALAAHQPDLAGDVPGFLELAATTTDAEATAQRVPTVATVATAATGQDWVRFTTERVSAWASSYFDEGQAIWRSADRTLPPFQAWREEAAVDRTPELMGLRGFRSTARSLPDDPVDAVEQVLRELGVPAAGAELYLHAVLLQVGGWAAHAARIVWDHGLQGQADDTLVQLLAVLLGCELGLRRALDGTGVPERWAHAVDELAAVPEGPAVRPALAHRLVLQEAFERAEQRRLLATLAPSGTPTAPGAGARPDAQAVFCIDVRSEVFRRHLEAAGDGIATMGFAGFFGVPIEYVPLAHDQGEAQCPVLLTPAFRVAETAGDGTGAGEAVAHRRLEHHVRRAWKSFKMGAISCFSFVGPVGLVYLPKLFTDGFGATRPVPPADTEGLPRRVAADRHPTLGAASPVSGTGIPLEGRVQLAEGALRAMSLTDGFAPLVLVTGHGATTVNNPYDTALGCGACGGHTGEANARVAVAILNDPEVRAALAARRIHIADDVWFLAGQHDTTTDVVTVFDRSSVPPSHTERLAELEAALAGAGGRARAERAARLGVAGAEDVDAAVLRRSTDWAQVRPEWGLAGCRAFVVAPRHRTAAVDLAGRSFLHSYEWRQDEGFGVLELIMTAPMVVASWISLQYYGSTVDNERFGSGNKTLHNVVGRIGVLEGNSGDLRTGLPWQSVHDGTTLQHEPVRLNVVIEAPLEAMNRVLAAHPEVRRLCDNGWVHLLAMDDGGRVSHRYAGDLRWEPVPA